MRFLMLFAIVGLTVFFSSCKENVRKMPEIQKVDKTSKEYASKYICPMYCVGSGSDKMGICPVCEMDYELNESMNNDDHGHDHHGHDHHGHDHHGHDH